MIVVDTTVLVYAVGQDHPLRQPCRTLVAAVRDGRLQATTTVEVVQEFAHVRARRRSRDDAAALARDFAGLLRPLIVMDEGDLDDGLSLYSGNQQLGPSTRCWLPQHCAEARGPWCPPTAPSRPLTGSPTSIPASPVSSGP